MQGVVFTHSPHTHPFSCWRLLFSVISLDVFAYNGFSRAFLCPGISDKYRLYSARRSYPTGLFAKTHIAHIWVSGRFERKYTV